MKENSARRFMALLRTSALDYVASLYADTKIFPRVVPGAVNFYNFALEKQQTLSEVRNQFEQHLPDKLVTTVEIDSETGELNVRHPGGGKELFQITELTPEGFEIAHNGEILNTDQLVQLICKPIYDAPGRVS